MARSRFLSFGVFLVSVTRPLSWKKTIQLSFPLLVNVLLVRTSFLKLQVSLPRFARPLYKVAEHSI